MFKIIAVTLLLILCFPIASNASVGESKEVCEQQQGVLKEFGSGCRGSCLIRRFPEHIVCASVMSYGCECGQDKCWNDDTNQCEKIVSDDALQKQAIENQRQKYIDEEQKFLRSLENNKSY